MSTESDPSPVGVILAGGASRRMGRDKAFLGPPHRPLIQRVVDAVVAVAGADTVVVGGDGERLRTLGRTWLADDDPGAGPLGGIATAARAHPDRPLVVAACDLPWIDDTPVAQLWQAVADGAPGAVFLGEQDIPQWSLVALGSGLATVVVERFDSGDRAIHAVLGGRVLELRPPRVLAVADVDHPEDLPPDLR